MSNRVDPVQRRRNRRAMIVVLLVCGLAPLVGMSLLVRLRDRTFTLQIAWVGDALQVFSLDSKPFVVTHLFLPGSARREAAVAQLPEPVTIIDSRGHYFVPAELQTLIWVGASGRTNPPPEAGMAMKAFYWKPWETEATPKQVPSQKKAER